MPIMVYISLFNSRLSWLIKIPILAVLLFSLEMVRRMILVILKRMEREKEMKSKQIEYQWFSQDDDKLRQLSFFRQL